MSTGMMMVSFFNMNLPRLLLLWRLNANATFIDKENAEKRKVTKKGE
jgi:hypothetical protein